MSKHHCISRYIDNSRPCNGWWCSMLRRVRNCRFIIIIFPSDALFTAQLSNRHVIADALSHSHCMWLWLWRALTESVGILDSQRRRTVVVSQLITCVDSLLNVVLCAQSIINRRHDWELLLILLALGVAKRQLTKYKLAQLSSIHYKIMNSKPVIKIVTLQLSHISFKHINIFLCNGPLCSNLQYISCTQ